MKKKAIIISLSGFELTQKEKSLFKKDDIPWGVILFKRNIKNYIQLKKLIFSIRQVTKDKRYPILIDEEGGVVSRLSNIFNNKNFSQKYFGKMYEVNKTVGLKLYKYYLNQVSLKLNQIGININTVPVMDKLYKNTNSFLRERVYSSKIETIKSLSKICLETYKKNKVFTVIKHIPGHGLSKSDSHKKLPVVKKDLKFLINNDFKCFTNTKALFAMTAHILYEKIDKKNCVTHSKKIINNIIRKKIGFNGIIISDDIEMKSLKHDVVRNALKALSSGCNLALYCSGKYNISYKLLRKIPHIDEFTSKKTSQFYKFLR